MVVNTTVKPFKVGFKTELRGLVYAQIRRDLYGAFVKLAERYNVKLDKTQYLFWS